MSRLATYSPSLIQQGKSRLYWRLALIYQICLQPFLLYLPSLLLKERHLLPRVDSSEYETVHSQIRTTLEDSRKAYKRQADRLRLDAPSYSIGDKVLPFTKNLRTTRPTRKFSESDRSQSPDKFRKTPAIARQWLFYPVDPLEPIDLKGDAFYDVENIVYSPLLERKKALEYRIE